MAIRCLTRLPNIRGQGVPLEFFYDEDNAVERAAAAQFIRREDRTGFGVFHCPNPLTARKRSLATVAAIEWLWVDLDFKDIEESASEAALLFDMFDCKPTKIIDSGHGRHVYWKLKEPLERGDRWFERATELYKQLAEQVGGDTAPAHPAALMRVPGTHNSKDGTLRECKALINTGYVVDVGRTKCLMN